MFVNYDRNATMFSAVNVNAITRSKSELASEEQNDKAIGAAGNAENASNIQTFNGLKTTGKMVMFNDPTSGNRVQLQLTDENLKRLEEKFGSQDFYKREDGTIRLSGKAEAFVSGWFADVAYRQNFVGADKDKDGVISKAEFGDLRIGRGGMVSGTINNAQITDMQAYAKVDSYWYDELTKNGDLNATDALNRFIETDKDLDGVTTAQEEFSAQELQELVRDALGNSKGGLSNQGFNPMAEFAKLVEEAGKDLPKAIEADRKKRLEEEKRLEEIRAKRKENEELLENLREKNGEIAKLNDSQKALIADSEVVKNNTTGKLDSKEIDKLAKELQKVAESEVLGNVAKTQTNNPLSELDKELISVVDNIRKETQSGGASAVDALDVRA